MTRATRLPSALLTAALALQALCAAALAADNARGKAADEAAPRIQMAILLDTSGSMTGLINQARAQLWKIVNEFATARQDGREPRLEVALYEYGNSGLVEETGWIRQIVPLTDDLDKVSEALFALTTNGGSEHCGQVIDAAVRELAWSRSDRDLKCIFIAGNEPFAQGPIDYREACQAAVKRGVTVSTIHCGPQETGVQTGWQDGAVLADGSFMSIDQNQAVAEIPAPQDKELAALGEKLNTTYVAFGEVETRKAFALNQIAQDANAAIIGCPTAATRALTKASNQYCNRRWDLVDACRLKDVKLEDLTDAELPEELRPLSLEERKAYVARKQRERDEIQAKIQKLGEARSEFLAEARRQQAESGGANSLDDAIIESVRREAGRKQFTFAN